MKLLITIEGSIIQEIERNGEGLHEPLEITVIDFDGDDNHPSVKTIVDEDGEKQTASVIVWEGDDIEFNPSVDERISKWLED